MCNMIDSFLWIMYVLNFIVDFINQFKLNYKKIVVPKRKTGKFLNRMNYKKKI